MKTMKQVLAMFQRMQRQLVNNFDGIVTVEVYTDGGYWAIKLSRATFTDDSKIKTIDRLNWDHYTYQGEETERKNEKKVAEFKERFGLK